jgi:preprotein translocase subunit YajC
MTLLLTLLLAAPQAAEAPNPLFTFAPLVLIFIVFYFLMIRPQQKREKQRKEMIAAISKGDKVVTIGGLHGTVQQIDETSVLIQADANVKLRVEKSAIGSVQA